MKIYSNIYSTDFKSIKVLLRQHSHGLLSFCVFTCSPGSWREGLVVQWVDGEVIIHILKFNDIYGFFECCDSQSSTLCGSPIALDLGKIDDGRSLDKCCAWQIPLSNNVYRYGLSCMITFGHNVLYAIPYQDRGVEEALEPAPCELSTIPERKSC